jgi:hypothetical protein
MKAMRTMDCGRPPSGFARGTAADFAADEWWRQWKSPLRHGHGLECVIPGRDHGGIELAV